MDLSTIASTEAPVSARTLLEISQWRALHQPQQKAYTFLTDEEESVSLTYAELETKARAVAARLQASQAKGSRTLIIYPPGLEYIIAFWGCIYAGVVAVPVYPPRLNRSVGRLRSIFNDAQPETVLTNAHTLAAIQRKFAHDVPGDLSDWIATDILEDHLAESWQAPRIAEDTLAFLQYSSGSTGTPKGVMLSHKNVLHNVEHQCKRFASSPTSRGVTWLPPYHDLGLIGGIIQPLYMGFPMVSMSPFRFLQRPVRWLQAISTYRGTHSVAPDFAYALCVRKIDPAERVRLDLSCWEFAACGAEPIHPETLDRFVETFGPCGFQRKAFYPCYGLAEATLFVTGNKDRENSVVKTFHKAELLQKRVVPVPPFSLEAKAFVGCGQVLDDQKLVIVDPQTARACSPGEVGEIWVAGPSVAQGYWNNPEETARTFHAFLADTGEGPFLRTGDAGFLVENELFIAGRFKDLIIIRGNNYYPQDIELTVGECHPALRQGGSAAFSTEVDNEERLVVLQEVERNFREDFDVETISQAIRGAVMEQHGVLVSTVVLVRHGSIPKTSSGKVQRYLCRQDFLAHRLNVLGEHTFFEAQEEPAEPSSQLTGKRRAPYVAPQTPAEQMLADAWAEVLGVERVGIEDDFFALGGDSLLATQLISRLQDVFQQEIPLRLLFEQSTIAGILQSVEEMEKEIDPDEDELSLVPQERTWHVYEDL